MMTHASSSRPRERRALLLGAAAIAMILGAARGLPAAMRWRQERLESSKALIDDEQNSQMLVRALPSLRDWLVARRVRLAALDSAVLDARSPSDAGAALAELVSDAADVSESQLGSVQMERVDSIVTAKEPLTRVLMRASVTGDLESIAILLSALEE